MKPVKCIVGPTLITLNHAILRNAHEVKFLAKLLRGISLALNDLSQCDRIGELKYQK